MEARGMLKPVYFAFVQTMLEFFLQTTHLVKSRAHSPRPTSKIIAVTALTRAILMKADPVVSLLACSAVAHAHAKKTPVPRTDDFLRKFLGCIDYQIFLLMVLRCVRYDACARN